MRILILSLYFRPDLSAGAFRSSALIDQLKQYHEHQIDVITTLPNRYATFQVDASAKECDENVTIFRIPLPPHKNGMLDQCRSFLSFYTGALRLTKSRQYDLVFATSSRLFTAFLGARIARRKKLQLYLDIRDLFCDTMGDILPALAVFFLRPFFYFTERYAFGYATCINIVSKGFAPYFCKKYPKIPLQYYTNGIDPEFLLNAPQTSSFLTKKEKWQVLYTGNIGEGQGLHTILPQLAKHFEDSLDFVIVGDGGRKRQLKEALAASGVVNVTLLNPVKREEVVELYKQADVLFVHLNDYPAFKKVLPSKLFEYAAMGKPIWAGVAGFAAEFIQAEVDNSAVFHPGKLELAVSAFGQLQMIVKPRQAFIQKFSRENIMNEMAHDILATR